VPEGDTIFRAAATLSRALVGRKVSRFETAYAQLSKVDDQEAIAGRTIDRVWAEGKHLLIAFSGGQTLRTHMRMSGGWHIYRIGERWQRPRSDMRIIIETDAQPENGLEGFVAVAFSVPVAEFLNERQLARSPELLRLGPDLLGETFDAKVAVQRLRARPDQPMSEVLLDQQVAAGAGNVFRSEVLFLSGIDPARLASDVSDSTLERMFLLARELLRGNVGPASTGGIVTYTGFRRTTRRSDERERLWVYGRSGNPCRKCGTAIAYRKTGPDARGLYYCPTCQI
jgi:endonuclease-8